MILGTITCNRFDEFSENYVALFLGGPKICNEIHSELRDPPPFFRKIQRFYSPKNTEKTATKFFGSEMTPPPFGSFPKIQ